MKQSSLSEGYILKLAIGSIECRAHQIVNRINDGWVYYLNRKDSNAFLFPFSDFITWATYLSPLWVMNLRSYQSSYQIDRSQIIKSSFGLCRRARGRRMREHGPYNQALMQLYTLYLWKQLILIAGDLVSTPV